MDAKRFSILCGLTLAGAFAGGYFGNRSIPVAHAQGLPPMDVRGSSFTLVGPQGQTEAVIQKGTSGGELLLQDARGNVRVEISGSGGIVFRDQMGHITWRSPRGNGIVPLKAGSE